MSKHLSDALDYSLGPLSKKKNARIYLSKCVMASHRIGARVAGLSPAQLCAIIEAQAGASDAALRVAEEHAARLVEQPEWVLSEVLLSPDLAPHILAQLPTKEHAASRGRDRGKAGPHRDIGGSSSASNQVAPLFFSECSGSTTSEAGPTGGPACPAMPPTPHPLGSIS